MRFLLFVSLFLLSPFEVYANEVGNFCALSQVSHRPDADVNYVPGVDVRGKAVAPADLNDHSSMVPDVIKIPVTLDLAERLGGGLPAGTLMESEIAMIEIHGDGRVLMNGHDISTASDALCSRVNVLKEKTKEASQGLQKPEKIIEQPKAMPPQSNGVVIWGEGQ